MLAFYSENPSSNPAEVYLHISVLFENKQKEAGVGPFFKFDTSSLFETFDLVVMQGVKLSND